MRNPWKTLLFRTFSRFPIQSSRIKSFHHQVRHQNPQRSRFFFSFLTRNAILSIDFDPKCRNTVNRGFSMESAALEHKDYDQVVLVEIFSKSIGPDEIRTELQSLNLSFNHETLLSVLRNLDGSPEIARRFFDWASEAESGKLSSKSYNLMLGILGRKDYAKEFWELVEIMKKKGYGISKNTFVRVSENFSKEGLISDSDMLRDMYTSRPGEDSLERVCSSVCRVIRENEWGESMKMKLEDMSIVFSGDLVSKVLEQLGIYPMKALMFFEWAQVNLSFKHDAQNYNAMAIVLGRGDCIVEFWSIVNRMKDAGSKMEMATYVKISARFFKSKMMKDAVDLYEFMMGSGSDKPPVHDCLFLLRKIVVANDLDMDLFSRVLRIFREGGNVVTKSLFDGVLKSLTGASKLGEREKILKAMEEWGFVASDAVYGQVILGFCKARKFNEACEYLDKLESSGHNPGSTVWASLIQGHCAVGEMDKASSCLRKMVERKGALDAICAFEILVGGFCEKNRENDAYKFLIEMANEKQLKPSYATYKMLIEKLLVRGCLKEATNLLGVMRNHGFGPFIDPFINYVAKSGTGDDAMSVLKAMTVKRLPSTSAFLRMFEAFFKAGRHDVAHGFLSKSPRCIRGHADVLNLFCSLKPGEAEGVAAVVS